MARFNRIDVALRMREAGIIPLYYNNDPDICRNAVKACYEGGIKIFEFTNRGDYAHEIFSDLNKWIEKELPNMIMGVGMGTNLIKKELIQKKDRKGLTKSVAAALKIAKMFQKL